MAEKKTVTVEEELAIAYQMMEGNRAGLFRLLEAYAPRVKWLLLNRLGNTLTDADIDNVLLVAAEKAFKAAESFDERKSGMGGWFYTIAYRTAIDRFRRVGGKAWVRLPEEPPAPTDENPEPGSHCDEKVLADLRVCAEALGELQQKIIQADLLAGGTVDAEQLSRKLGVPKQHVYSYRNKGRQALLNCMMKRGHTAETIWSRK